MPFPSLNREVLGTTTQRVNKMATVSFSGSSNEDIENAKAFWRGVDPPPKQLSTLTVSGVDHRLPKVPDPPRNATQHAYSILQQQSSKEDDPALLQHQETAQRLKETQDAAYVNKIKSFREDAQQLLRQRKQERTEKEEISRYTVRTDPFEELFDPSDNEDDDNDEAWRTMDELDKFESNLRQKEATKPS